MVVRKTQLVARSAFTLMEMMVVVTIIVMLAGGGTYYYMKYLDDAKVSTAKAGVRKLTDTVEMYKLKHGDYPDTLQVLTQRDDENPKPYIDQEALKTPWGGQYGYDKGGANNGGAKPDIFADGPNGVKVGNWPGSK